MIHEDDRRILESYPEAKVIRFKKKCTIGKHYHKIKTEKFILLNGRCTMESCTIKEDGNVNSSIDFMIKGKIYTIKPGTYHSFLATEETVLLGINSHAYDPQDDYKI